MTLLQKDGTLINAERQDDLEKLTGDFVEGSDGGLSRVPSLPCRGLEEFRTEELKYLRSLIRNQGFRNMHLDIWLTAPFDLLLFVVRGHNTRKLRPDAVRLFSCTDGNTGRSLENLPFLPLHVPGNTENQHNNSKDLSTYVRAMRKRRRGAAC